MIPQGIWYADHSSAFFHASSRYTERSSSPPRFSAGEKEKARETGDDPVVDFASLTYIQFTDVVTHEPLSDINDPALLLPVALDPEIVRRYPASVILYVTLLHGIHIVNMIPKMSSCVGELLFTR